MHALACIVMCGDGYVYAWLHVWRLHVLSFAGRDPYTQLSMHKTMHASIHACNNTRTHPRTWPCIHAAIHACDHTRKCVYCRMDGWVRESSYCKYMHNYWVRYEPITNRSIVSETLIFQCGNFIQCIYNECGKRTLCNAIITLVSKIHVGWNQSHKFYRDPIQKKPSAVFVIVLAEKSAEGFSV